MGKLSEDTTEDILISERIKILLEEGKIQPREIGRSFVSILRFAIKELGCDRNSFFPKIF